MPIANPRSSSGLYSYKGPTTVDVNFHNAKIDKIGGKDTYLSNLLGKSYDDKLNPYYNQNDQRFRNENWFQWGVNNGLGLFTKGVVMAIPAMAGGVTSLAMSPVMNSAGYSFADSFEKNPINQFTDWANVLAGELTPTFTSEEYKDRGFIDSLKNPGQLVSANVDSLAFLVQSFVGAGFLGKLGVGSKVASKLAKVRTLDEMMTLGAQNVAAKAGKIDFLLSHSVLTTSESAMEAKDSKEQIKTKLAQSNLEGKTAYSQDQIEEMSDSAARNVFWLNMATMAVSNIPFTKLVSPLFRAGNKGTAAAVNRFGLTFGENGVAAPAYSGAMKRFLSNDKSYGTGQFIRSLGEQVVSEGLEESLQYSIQKVNEVGQGSLDFSKATERYLKDILAPEGAIFGITNDKERAKAAGLGSLLGGGGTAIAAGIGAVRPATGLGAFNQARTFKQERDAHIKRVNESYFDVVSPSLFEKEEDISGTLSKKETEQGIEYYNGETRIEKDEYDASVAEHKLPEEGGSFTIKGGIKLDEQQRPIISAEKLEKALSDARIHNELDMLIENEELSSSPNENKLAILNQYKLAQLARSASEAGVMDLLKERFETIASSPEDIEKYGIDPDMVKQYTQDLDKFKNLYDNVNLDFLENVVADPKVQQKRKAMLYDLGSRRVIFEGIAKNLTDQLATKTATIYKPEETEALDTLTQAIINEDRLNVLFDKYTGLIKQNQNKQAGTLLKEINALSQTIKDDAVDYASAAVNEQIEQAAKIGAELSYINDGIKEVTSKFNKYSKSYNSFKNDWDRAAVETVSNQGDITLPLEPTTPTFDAFMKRAVKRGTHTNRKEVASAEFFSEATNSFLERTDASEVDLPQLKELLEYLIASKGRIYQDEALKLVSAINKRIATLQSTASGVPDFDPETDYAETPEQEAAEAAFNELQASEAFIKNLPKLIDQLTALVVEPLTGLKDAKQIERDTINGMLSGAMSLVNKSQEFPEDFDDIVEVDVETKKLTNILNALGENYSSYADDFKDALDALKGAREVAVKNAANKERKNIKQNKLYYGGFRVALPLIANQGDRDKVALLFEGNEELASRVTTDLLRDKDSDVGELLSKSIIEFTKALNAAGYTADEKEVAALAYSPIRAFDNILTKAAASAFAQKQDPRVDAYVRDYDIVKLHDSTTDGDPLRTLLDTYFQIAALVDISNGIASEITSETMEKRLLSFANERKTDGKKPVPSTGQERAILALARFISSPMSKPQLFTNGCTIKAPAGAGKSLVVTPTLLHVLDLKPENILTAAPKVPAAKNIAAATQSKYGENTITKLIADLKDDKIDEAVSLIIVDEAGAMSIAEFYEFSAQFTQYTLRHPDRKVKFLLIQDPNQVTPSSVGISTIDTQRFFDTAGFVPNFSPLNASKGLEGVLRGEGELQGLTLFNIQQLYEVAPLSVTYRADVAAITDTANKFLTSRVVSALNGQTSADLTSPKDIIGAATVVEPAALKTVIGKSVELNPGRSRVIVVGSEARKADYEGIGVEVLTTLEASGITKDEVYVDVRKTDFESPYFSDDAFNRHVYTAITRASQFVLISGYTGTNNTDPTLHEKAKLNADKKKSFYDQTIDAKNAALLVYKEFNRTQNSTEAPVAAEPTAKPVTEEEILVDDQATPTPPVVTPNNPVQVTPPTVPPVPAIPDVVGGGVFKPTFVNNTALKMVLDNPQRIAAVHDTSNGLSRIAIGTHQNGVFTVLAIVGDKELDSFTAATGLDKNKLSQVSLVKVSASEGQDYEMAERTFELAPTLKLSAGSTKLSFIYDDYVTDDFASGILPTVVRYLKTAYPNTKLPSTEAEALSMVRLRIYKTEAELAEDGITNPDVLLGRPYIIFDNVKLKTLTGGIYDGATHYVELSPAKMGSTQASMDSNNIGEISKFTNRLREFEELLASSNLPENYRNMRLGTGIRVSASEVYYPFHSFVIALSDAYKGKDGLVITALDEVNKKFSAIGQELVGLNTEDIPTRLLELAHDLDVMVHGERLEKEGRRPNRAYKGKAQLAFDNIAQSNLMAHLPTGQLVILRDIRTTVTGDGKVDSVAGASLLGPLKYTHTDSYGRIKSYNAALNTSRLDGKSSTLRATILKRAAKNPEWLEHPLIKDINENSITHFVPFVSEDLANLFSKEGLEGTNYGNGLYVPLNTTVWSSKADGSKIKLNGYVVSKFNRVVPTTIGLSKEDSSIDVDKSRVVRPPQGRIEKEIIKTGQATPENYSTDERDSFIETMRASTFQDAVTKYNENFTTSKAYKLQQSNLRTLLAKAMRKRNKEREFILQGLLDSAAAEDSEGYAARDYMRAIIGAFITYEQNAVDLLRFGQSNSGSERGMMKMIDFIDSRVSLEAFKEREAELTSILKSIADEYGITFEEKDRGAIDFVEYVAKEFSSNFRKKGKLKVTEETKAEAKEEVIEAKAENTSSEAIVSLSSIAAEYLEIDNIRLARLTILQKYPAEYATLELDGKSDEDVRDIMESIVNERSMRRAIPLSELDPVSAQEAVAEFQRMLGKPSYGILDRIFNRKRGEPFRIVSKAFMEFTLGRDNWGLFKDGLVYVVEEGGQVGKKVVRHEVFHKVVNGYLSQTEKLQLFQLLRERYGDLDQIALEEHGANEFMNYYGGGGFIQGLRKIFRKIARFFNFTYNNLKSLEEFYSSIEEGYYRGMVETISEGERDLNIRMRWPSVAHFTLAKNIILDQFDFIYASNRNVQSLYSFDEAVIKTFDSINKIDINELALKYGQESSFVVASLKPFLASEGRSSKALSEFMSHYFGNVRYTETFDGLGEEDLDANIFGETFDTERIDPSDKLVGRVKQRLVGIKYFDKGVEKRAEFSAVYGMVIDLLEQIDKSSVNRLFESLQERAKALTPVYSSKNPKSNIRSATAVFISDFAKNLQEALSKSEDKIAIFKDSNFSREYAIVGKTPIGGKTYSDVKNDSSYSVIARGPNESTMQFVNRISVANGGNLEGVVNSFIAFEEISFLNSMTAAVTSLRTAKPHVYQESYSRVGALEGRYFTTKSGGKEAIIENRIINAFSYGVDSLSVLDNSIGNPDSAKRIDEKMHIVKNLLSFAGLTVQADQLKPLDAIELFKSYERYYDAFRQGFGKVEEDSDDGHQINAYDIISEEGTMIGQLIDAESLVTRLAPNYSYMRGDGEKAYLKIDASFQTALLSYLDNSLSSTKKAITDTIRDFTHLKSKNGALTTTATIYKKNIFLTGTSRIFGHVDHDSMKVKNSQFVTFLYGESPNDYHKRNFSAGFIAGFKTVSKTNTYVQYLPVPSNRRSIQGVRVNFHGDKDITKVLEGIIEQQMTRPSAGSPLLKDSVYSKRHKLFTLPGIENVPVDSMTKAEALERVLAAMDSDVETIMEYLENTATRKKGVVNFKIPKDKFRKIASKYVEIRGYVPESEYRGKLSTLRKKLKSASLEEYVTTQKLLEDTIAAREQKEREIVRKMARLFVMNYTANQYSLSQLIYGDETFFKHKEDVTKRIQVATATGDSLLLDPRFGLPTTHRVGIMEDFEPKLPKDIIGVRRESYQARLTETDGQGYITPQAYEKIALAYGADSLADVTLKPVYYSVDADGRPMALKYSLIVLTDEYIAQRALELGVSPESTYLYQMRESMYTKKLDQLVHKSGMKVGVPKKIAGLSIEDLNTMSDDSILTINMNDFRIQLNPSASTEKTVRNPSQATAFPNTNGKNEAESSYIHQLNAIVIDIGNKILNRDLNISSKGSFTGTSVKKVREMIARTAAALGTKKDVEMYATYRNPTGEFGVSLNFPAIAQQALSTLSSAFSKTTVGFRFPGSKLILVSEFGSYNAEREKLQWKDKDGYTEVLLPESYREFFTEGDRVVSKGIVGFRMPTTNMHSLIAMKVKGFYKAPEGSNGNIIIAPSAIVHFHGSD